MATRILTDVEGERFKTNGSVMIEEGWRALYRDEKKDAKADAKELPPLQPGDTREVVKTSVKASKTKPPLAVHGRHAAQIDGGRGQDHRR